MNVGQLYIVCCINVHSYNKSITLQWKKSYLPGHQWSSQVWLLISQQTRHESQPRVRDNIDSNMHTQTQMCVTSSDNSYKIIPPSACRSGPWSPLHICLPSVSTVEVKREKKQMSGYTKCAPRCLLHNGIYIFWWKKQVLWILGCM